MQRDHEQPAAATGTPATGTPATGTPATGSPVEGVRKQEVPHDRVASRSRRAASVVVLLLLCAAQFMVVLDSQVVNVALPAMQAGLGLSTVGLQWVVSAYALTFGGFLLLGGRIADLYGRRRTFVGGLVVFTVASLLGGLAQGQGVLLGARAVQGLGAALIAPAALSLITTTFTGTVERARALGAWAAVGASGVAAGVILGGVLTEAFSWRWVFFINVPIGLAALLLAPVVLARDPIGAQDRHLDLPGAVLVTAGFAALIYAIVAAEQIGLGSPATLVTLAVAAALLAGFVVVQRRSPAPLVDLSVFRRRSLTGGNVVATLASATFAPMFFLVSVYLQDAEGWSALRTGVAFLPMAAVLILTSGVLGPRLLPRVGVTTMAVGSLLLIAAGSALFAITLDPDRSYLLAVLPAMLMVATGMGLVFPAFMSAAVAGVPDRQQGLASGLVNTSQQVGAALGLAVLVSVAAAVAPTVSDDGGQALATGFRAAFAAAAALALLAAGAAAALLRERECAPAVAAGRSAHQVTPGCVPPRPDRPARPSTASRR